MSPISDQFLSCGVDKTLRLWDLRKPTCAGLMEVDGVAVGTFDPGKGAFLSIIFLNIEISIGNRKHNLVGDKSRAQPSYQKKGPA